MNISIDIKDNQIISIVGATATGKTAYALELAATLLAENRFQKIHLLSADSKQVYQGLENLSGADLPSDFIISKDPQFAYPFFNNESKNIFLHGVSIIDPKEEWSVAHFKKLFTNIKSQLKEDEFLIVVGGTGFYQQQLSQPADSLFVPQNEKLRETLETFSLEELQNKLQELNSAKLSDMNNSDRHNPRRLIRAIEIETATLTKLPKIDSKNQDINIPTFYLSLPKAEREQKIRQRVLARFDSAKVEVAKQLQNQQLSPLAESTLGFAQLKQLIEKEIDQATCIALWQTAEIQYAKRQDTWWKKRTDLCYI